MTRESVGVSIREDLLEQIDMERAKIGVQNSGDTPNRSEWFRCAARHMMRHGRGWKTVVSSGNSTEPRTSVGISLQAELLDEIDTERAQIGLEENGNVPNRSEWLRKAARYYLECGSLPSDTKEAVEA